MSIAAGGILSALHMREVIQHHFIGVLPELCAAGGYRTARAGLHNSQHHKALKYYIPTLTHNPSSLVQTDPHLVQELSDEVAMRWVPRIY